MKFIGIIPARYASTRFPGKPLAMLCGKSVIQRVCEQALKVLDDVIVATDDERIVAEVSRFGGVAVMTSDKHRSGTDRCWEAYVKNGVSADVVINIQGDEPFIQPEQITALMRCFDDEGTDIATMVKPYDSGVSFEVLSDPNCVKCVKAPDGRAMYFSRSVIPYLRGIDKEEWSSRQRYFKHLGIYAYRTDVLERITRMGQTPMELSESLEQLRWIENGLTIRTAETESETIGIDTPEDLAAAERFLQNQSVI